MNKNYIKGRAKEYRLMKKLKDEGYEIVARTAGSHSPIDIIGIKKIYDCVKVKFIQSKPKGYKKEKLMEELDWLNCKSAIVEVEVL